MPFDREQTKSTMAMLAAEGVFVGTSSWKYEGWFGQLYTPERYVYRGKIAKTRFERDCLNEYAEVFKTVCVDAAYYTFPRPDYLRKLADAVPDDFRFGFKVTDTVTIKKFPKLDRFGAKAGQPNSDFLNADLFATAFLKPCEDIRNKAGVLTRRPTCRFSVMQRLSMSSSSATNNSVSAAGFSRRTRNIKPCGSMAGSSTLSCRRKYRSKL
jgi:Protein of unknown function DUF72